MAPNDILTADALFGEDSFRFIKPEEFRATGIDPADIPPGTFPALKHPSHLPSRFGGNAYGLGLFELQARLKPKDVKFLQTISFKSQGDLKRWHKEINRIYKQIGLLIRYSSHGKPYYLIPTHLVSNTLSRIRSKVEEISKIVNFHGRKYLKEQHVIGLLTNADDLIVQELSYRFKEHRFVTIDSLEQLRHLNQTLDLAVVTRDLYELLLLESFSPLANQPASKKQLDQYVTYTLWKLYNVLKPEGEIFIIGTRYTAKTNRSVDIAFKNELEEKSFAVFSHIFKTKKKYHIKDHALEVNLFDFQNYLSGLYVEQEVLDRLLEGRAIEDMALQEIDALPYENLHLGEHPIHSAQEETWTRLLSPYFDEIFLKPLIPEPVKNEWARRFSSDDFTPHYMLIYLGQKRPLKTTYADLRREVMTSRMAGCPPVFLAEYRNTFEYVIRTLQVVERLKGASYANIPQIFIDRLTQPLHNMNRRFPALNDVIKLVNKTGRLKRVRDLLNPDTIEGAETKILENLEALAFFGFSFNELREIFLIVLGHTPMGRIISGKMNEKDLKPITELARTYPTQQAVNLLRYCRLMTMAEMEASRGSELTPEHVAELFDLYESTVRVAVNRELDWEGLLDEKIAAMGGIKNKIIRKLVKMINHFEFVNHWPELKEKGEKEKEAFADYDESQLTRINNLLRLIDTLERFEAKHLKADPLQFPAFYRKLFNTEFHGTGHIFERMDTELVFLLLWIVVNISRGEVINLNPLLKDVTSERVEARLTKIEAEARSINVRYLDLEILKQLGDQLYKKGSASIVGTGFQLKIDPNTNALEIGYTDMNRDIEDLEALVGRLEGNRLSAISPEDIDRIETLFSDLEGFYQSHVALLQEAKPTLKLPERQNRWFRKAEHLRDRIGEALVAAVFDPDGIYDHLNLLRLRAPALVNLAFPEFVALSNLDLPGHIYLKAPLTDYLLDCLKKFQALVRHDRAGFQDIALLHRLAQREFGPMATGTVGLSESQIGELETIVEALQHKRPLYRAVLAALLFQDLGRIPELRQQYEAEINPATPAQASAHLLEHDKIAERFRLGGDTKPFLVFLVRYHSLLHDIIRGEASFSAIQEVLDVRDPALFDGFFLVSFIMLAAMREDLMIEDLAGVLFMIRSLCKRAMGGEITIVDRLNELFQEKGNLFYGLESFKARGLPEGVSNANDLKSCLAEDRDPSEVIAAGRMIFALERLFRLRGIRFVEFTDLCNLMLRVPLKYIHQNRGFASIGYATFEREVYEAFRIYNTLQHFPEPARHFILDQLVGDSIRISGYEKVSQYLSYENQMKLILIALLAARKLKATDSPVYLNFLPMSRKIEKRYEAVNAYLNGFTTPKIWGKRSQLHLLFKTKTGLVLKEERFPGVISFDFHDRIDMPQKISHMATINHVDQLKNYFHFSLRSLRKHPFTTDDYELELEKAYETRLVEINDMIVSNAKRQMALLNDFQELHVLVQDLLDRALELGLTQEQQQRLNDLYDLRKDELKGEKVLEIEHFLGTIQDIHELEDYWSSIKWYLQTNRPFFGKEFETLIARKFDQAMIPS